MLRSSDVVLRDVLAEGPQAITEDGIQEEEVHARGLRGPQEPSAEEVARHALTHIPAMPWCEVCVRAKTNDLAHKRIARKDALVPLIQFDYAEAGEDIGAVNFEFVVGSDMSTGSIWSSAILQKGCEDVYSVASAVSWLAELGHAKIELQSGTSPAEQAFVMAVRARAIREEVCQVVLTRQAERYNSQANGGAERTVQTVRKQVRALKLAVEKRLGIKITTMSEFLTWLPRHAAWLYNRYHVRSDANLMPYEKTHSLKYQRPLVEMGEAVVCRRPGAQLNKLELTWLEGVWLGRDSRTDEHLIGTPSGICRSRAGKRKVESKRWDLELFQQMKWTPWQSTPTSRGRIPIPRTEQEPIVLGPMPRAPTVPAEASPEVPSEAPAQAPAEEVLAQEVDPGPQGTKRGREAEEATTPRQRPRPATSEPTTAPETPRQAWKGGPWVGLSPKRPLENPDTEQDSRRARLHAMICELQESCEASGVPEDEEYVHEGEDGGRLHSHEVGAPGEDRRRREDDRARGTQVIGYDEGVVGTLGGHRAGGRHEEEQVDDERLRAGDLRPREPRRWYASDRALEGYAGQRRGTRARRGFWRLQWGVLPGPTHRREHLPGATARSWCTSRSGVGSPLCLSGTEGGSQSLGGAQREGVQGAGLHPRMLRQLHVHPLQRQDEGRPTCGRLPGDGTLQLGRRVAQEDGARAEALGRGQALRDRGRGDVLEHERAEGRGGLLAQGKNILIDDVLIALGLENAKPSLVPEAKSETRQQDDEQKLNTQEHHLYRQCVGNSYSWLHIVLVCNMASVFSAERWQLHRVLTSAG